MLSPSDRGSKGLEDLSVPPSWEKPVPRAPLSGTVFPKVSAGFLCWSAGNQVSLFLWLTLISFCWQQSVAKCPVAFQKLPTNARAPGRRKVMSAYCTHEPGWTLRVCSAQVRPKPSRWYHVGYFSPHFIVQETKVHLQGNVTSHWESCLQSLRAWFFCYLSKGGGEEENTGLCLHV